MQKDSIFRIKESYYVTSQNLDIHGALDSFIDNILVKQSGVLQSDPSILEDIKKSKKHTPSLGTHIWVLNTLFTLRVVEQVGGYSIDIVELIC